jgi:hypothetical protein
MPEPLAPLLAEPLPVLQLALPLLTRVSLLQTKALLPRSRARLLLTRAPLLLIRALPLPARARALPLTRMRPLRELRLQPAIKAQESSRRRLHHCRCSAYWASVRLVWASSPVAGSKLSFKEPLSA